MVDIILGKQQKIILPKTIKLLEILFFLWILSRPVGPSSEENDNSTLLSKDTLVTPFSGWIGYIWRIVPLRCHSHVVIVDGQLLFSCREGDLLASAINLPESCRCSYCLWTPTYTLPDLSSFRNIWEFVHCLWLSSNLWFALIYSL